MKIGLYPGNFDPFHRGHAYIVHQAVKSGEFDKVIVCVTGVRESIFTVIEKAEMIQSYNLDWNNVEVDIWGQAGNMWWVKEDVVIVRGYRDQHDIDFEKEVREAITNKTGYTEFRYFESAGDTQNLSSTKVRKATEEFNLSYLKDAVTPKVITSLLERFLQAKLYVVCGRPGAGKSTVLNEIAKVANVGIIKVDEVVHEFRDLLKEKFKTDDLGDLVKYHEQQVAEFQGPLLLKRLGEILKDMVGKYEVILLECAYAIKYRFDRYFGNRMLYVDCTDFVSRNYSRGTPQYIDFAKDIPNFEKTVDFCHSEGIVLIYYDNNDKITDLKMIDLFKHLKGGS